MWPVLTRDGRGVLADRREVIFIERQGNDLVYHTRKEEYLHITPDKKIEIIADALRPLGFEHLFQSNIVNMSAIKYFDPELRLLYFEDDHEKSKLVTVRRESVSLVNRYLRDRRDFGTNYH